MAQKKLLLIKLGSLGDILQVSPVIPAIKAKTDYEIYVLTFTQHKELFQFNPKIKRVFGINYSFMGFIKAFFILLRGKFHVAINTHRSSRLDLLCYLAGISRRLGFSSPEKSTRFLTSSVPFDLAISRHKRYLALVSLLINDNVDTTQYLPEFIPNESIDPIIQLETSYIVIAPFGGANSFSQMPTRKWGKYQQLISDLLIKYPSYIIYVVGSAEEEINLNVLAQFDDRVRGYTKSIHHLAYLLQKAALFIGNDSFPLFMAVSQQCPSIGIFGPTDAQLIVSDYKNLKYIQAEVSCSPCYNPLDGNASIAYNCPFNTRCMEKISVTNILELASKIIR